MTLHGVKLTKEKGEAADGKADAHEAEAGADPGEKGSFCGEVDARVVFGGALCDGHRKIS